MKKLWFISLFLTLLSINAAAQTFSFVRSSPEYVNGSALQFEIVSYGTVTNLTGSSFQIRIIRTNVNVPAGWSTAICDIIACYPPNIDTAIANYPPGAGEISAHFYVDSIPGTGTFSIRAEKVSNPSENYTVTFGAIASPIGIIQISSVVNEFSLGQNYPNPFNPSTKIRFSIPSSEFVSLRVYDMLGREVKVIISQELSSGEYEVDFNAKNLSSGMYYYSLRAGENVSVRKMVLVR